MSRVAQRFLHYAKIDTMSNESANTTPSSEGQFNLARLLVAELEEVGASDVRLDSDHCYVYACIPATTHRAIPAIGFIAHLDTSPDVSGKQVNPQIIKSYNGQNIVLSAHDTLSPATCPDLSGYTGMDIITSDGTTLLGADDKPALPKLWKWRVTSWSIPNSNTAI